MTFTIVATIATVASTLLGIGFLLAPSFMLDQWGLTHESPTVFLSRRIGSIYLGLAVLFVVGRDAPPSRLRDAVCIGLAIALVFLALTGIIERAAKRVSAGIAVSIVVELFLAASFAWVATR
jgi:cell division protein FtsW (lipid II flippase)